MAHNIFMTSYVTCVANLCRYSVCRLSMVCSTFPWQLSDQINVNISVWKCSFCVLNSQWRLWSGIFNKLETSLPGPRREHLHPNDKWKTLEILFQLSLQSLLDILHTNTKFLKAHSNIGIASGSIFLQLVCFHSRKSCMGLCQECIMCHLYIDLFCNNLRNFQIHSECLNSLLISRI